MTQWHKRRKYPNAWRPEEDQLIIDNWCSVTAPEMTAMLPGRTLYAVRRRVLVLREKGYNVGNKRHDFTPEEDAFIRANCKKLSLLEVAEKLGRHRNTVAVHATELRVSFRKTGDLHHLTKYTDDDVRLIIALRDDGMTFREIAYKFEMRAYTVRDIYNTRKTANDCLNK